MFADWNNLTWRLHQVFASLFNDRAIAYRVHQGFDHSLVALSVGVQTMVRSDIGAAGVIFTLDTESGFRDAVFITTSYGLGETVVQGAVNPDEFYVYKPALRERQVSDTAQEPRQQGHQDGLQRRPDARQDRRHGRCRRGETATDSHSATTTSSSLQRWRSRSRITTSARWTSNGARMARTASSTFCRRDRRPSRAAAAGRSSDSR